MAFTSTIDSRPHVLGDLMMVTGTYSAASVATGTIDLSSMLSSIVAAGLNGDAVVSGGGATAGDFACVTTALPTTITVDCVSGNTGTWWALGKRN